MVQEFGAKGEFYISTFLGKRIYDAECKKIGKIRDLAVLWDGVYPRVTGIKYAKGNQKIIKLSEISRFDKKGLHLKNKKDSLNNANILEDELFVKKWLLDKQIVDIKGVKLVRVNDIQLSWYKRKDTSEITLSAVDVGVRGLIRRVFGYEPKTERLPVSLLDWKYLDPIHSRTANIKLLETTNKFTKLHPADIAEIIEDLDHYERPQFISSLDAQTAAEALGEVDLDKQVNIIKHMDSTHVSRILEEMAPDEAADLLGELTHEKSAELLNLMEPEEAEDVRGLMEYPENTAGALMTTEYIALSEDMTAQQVIEHIRETAHAAEMIYYLYVSDENGKLLGVISLRELITAPPLTLTHELMQDRIITVLSGDDHKDVLDTIVKYDLIAVPVVDEDNRMLGIITVDDVINTIVPDRKNLESFSYFMMRKAFGRR